LIDYHIPRSISLTLFHKHNVEFLFTFFHQMKKILPFKNVSQKQKEQNRIMLF